MKDERTTVLSIILTEMTEADIPFLCSLWHRPDVNRYANEFPVMRGWSRADDPPVAWEKYLAQRTRRGTDYTQLIIRTTDHTRIGESMLLPLWEGYTFGQWPKPDHIKGVMADLKLMPTYWGQGLGTMAMKQVVQYVFTRTNNDLFLVPPHEDNTAAQRMYVKAGFIPVGIETGIEHRLMEITRDRFKEEIDKAGN
jgi:RimJ/RimL family protein N-acetyltransferase